MTDIQPAATYSATVSRDATASPGMDWGYEASRNGIRFSRQLFFSCAADAERYLRQRIAKEAAIRGDVAPSISIVTKARGRG